MENSTIINNYCPRCGQLLDQIIRRLIVEVCGHRKCRDCFIKEANGCEDCRDAQNTNLNEVSFSNGLDINTDSIGVTDVQQKNGTNKQRSIKYNIENNDKFIVNQPANVSSNLKKRNRTKFTQNNPQHITITKIDDKTVVYNCSVCRKEFKSPSNRKYHFYCDKSIDKPWHCIHCEKTFITKSHLNYHIKTHETKNHFYQCLWCDKKFLRSPSLRKHVQKKHDCKFKFVCDLCGQQFMYRDELKQHENKHSNIQPFQCERCDRRFASKSSFRHHLLVHEGIRYKCDKCNKTFTHSSSLKIHQLIHGKFRQFHCRKCSKTFQNQNSMKRHLKSHSEKKRYKCSLCNTSSTRRDNIQRHVRNLHAENQNQKNFITIVSNNKSTLAKNTNDSTQCIETIDKNLEQQDYNKIKNFCSVIQYTGRSIRTDKEDEAPITKPSDDTEKQLNFSIQNNQETELIVDTTSTIGTTVSTTEKANLKMYRQLLSPYLKPPQEVLNQTKYFNNKSGNSNGDFLHIKPLTEMIKQPTKKGYHHMEIYRRILMPDHDNHIKNHLNLEKSSNEIDLLQQQQQVQIVAASSIADPINCDHFTEIHWRKRTSQSFNNLNAAF